MTHPEQLRSIKASRHLAEKILTSRAALEGERKQVTVLFVDVAGFTAMSERLDPEDGHAIMRRAFELMLADAHRYEGTVNQFLGDGIMAAAEVQPRRPPCDATISGGRQFRGRATPSRSCWRQTSR